MTQVSAVAAIPARHRVLVRGESIIAFMGIAITAILLAMAALAGWWSIRGQQDASKSLRRDQVRALTNVLSQSAESMLQNNDLSSLRRMLIEAKQDHGLAVCRITLPDGRIIADADPTKINLATIPAQWPTGAIDTVAASDVTPDNVVLSQPLMIRGKGAATLLVAALPISGSVLLWETGAGIALIGAAGLAAMLIVYRRMRTKVMTLGLIRESLLATTDGSAPSFDALTIKGALGPEAVAWNHLLEENENLRKAGVAERVKGSLGSRREARSDLEHACDALSVGMIVVDEKAFVKHVNGAAAVLLQVQRDKMVGQLITTLIDDAAVKEVIGTIVAGAGQRRTLEIRRSAEQGGGILRIHIRPVRREDSGGALVTIEDITQQRVADAARNSFVAQATHELRTPLTNMRLCLEDALDTTNADPETMRKNLNVINQETRRLERMVGEMLSVAEIEAGSLNLKRDDVRLDKLFDELRLDYQPQATDKQITLLFDLPPKFPVIQGDRDKLMVTLHNLLGNALKYTPAGGKVTVALRSDASHVIVDVTDTGIGVTPEEQQKIFEKFYRAKDPRVEKITGTGLGLALAREIARLHNGDVAVQSELDKGSTFTLILPAHVQAQAA